MPPSSRNSDASLTSSSRTTGIASPKLTTAPPAQGSWAPASSNEAIRPAVSAVILTIGVFMSVYIVTKMNLPEPSKYKPSTEMPFDWVNAKKHIARMADRYRFVSSNGLEEAMQYIHSEMVKLSQQAQKNNLDLQLNFFRSGPSSFATSLGIINIRHSYVNLSSLAVRLSPHDVDIDNKQPLLLNAHVDSAIGAPGVNDELSGVGILMDIIRALVSIPNDSVQEGQQLNRPIIFLFNGAEEVILQGAHSFITQHPWAHNVAAHINLESLGSGNEYLMFRLGPNNPWLAHAYAKAVSYPFTSVTATDAYNTKLIPGETDYRIFDEFAGIPGFDFVYTGNGFIYHTHYDDMDHLDDQGLLHAGITVYELMMELAGKNDAIGRHLDADDELEEASSALTTIRQWSRYIFTIFKSHRESEPPADRKVVFFDVLHRFTLVYDEELAFFFHGFSLLLAILVWAYKLSSMPVSEWVSCIRMVFVFAISMFAALLSSAYAGIVYSRILHNPLVWYGSMARAIVVFGIPALSGMCTALLNLLPRRLVRRHFEHALFAHSFFLMVLSFVLLRANAMCAYIPALCLFISSLVALQYLSVSPMGRHLQITIVHAVFTCRLLTMTLSAFLPILGRAGIGSSNPLPGNIQVAFHDIIAGLIVSTVLVLYIGLPLLPILAHYAPAIRRLRSISVAASLWTAFIFVVVLPSLNGHRERGVVTPYTENAPKRLSLIHFHAPQMYSSLESPFSILQVASMDAVDVDLERLCAHLATSDADEDIASLPTRPSFDAMEVGPMESVFPFGKMLHHKHWLRSGNIPLLDIPKIEIEEEVKLERTDDEKNINAAWNMSVEIHAPDSFQITVRMRSKDNGGQVSHWSLNSPLEEPSGFVWVKHHGSDRMRFWMIVPSAPGLKDEERPKVTIVLSSLRLGKSRSPKDFLLIDSTVKQWESPSYMVSTAYVAKI